MAAEMKAYVTYFMNIWLEQNLGVLQIPFAFLK